MLLKHGFLFQANDGGESCPSRLKRGIHGRNWGSAQQRSRPLGALNLGMDPGQSNACLGLSWTVGAVYIKAWTGKRASSSCDSPCGPVRAMHSSTPCAALAQSQIQDSSLISFAANFDFS